jgi:GAF domain-containing protein
MNSKPRNVERERHALLTLGGVLLTLMCGALILATWSGDSGGVSVAFTTRWPALVGLGGLVLIFVLYATRKQRELSMLDEKLRVLAVREATLSARIGELSYLFDVSTQLQLRLDLQGMTDLAAQRLLPCLEAHQSSIMLFNATTGVLEVKAVAGVDANLVAGSTVKPGEDIAGVVYSTGQPLVLTPDVIRSRFPHLVKPGRTIRSSVCVPMRFRDQTIGVMSVVRADGADPFTPMHATMLEKFAEHVAGCILKIHHHHQVLEGVRRAA